MSKLSSSRAIAGALLALPFLGASPALAASPVTFVSGKGTDTGNCADPAHPCRSFQFAIDQTSPGGEIKALDHAHYGRPSPIRSASPGWRAPAGPSTAPQTPSPSTPGQMTPSTSAT